VIAALASKLIAAGADVNASDRRGQTPLARAAHRQHFETIVKLLEHRADINAIDDGGILALENLDDVESAAGLTEEKLRLTEEKLRLFRRILPNQVVPEEQEVRIQWETASRVYAYAALPRLLSGPGVTKQEDKGHAIYDALIDVGNEAFRILSENRESEIVSKILRHAKIIADQVLVLDELEVDLDDYVRHREAILDGFKALKATTHEVIKKCEAHFWTGRRTYLIAFVLCLSVVSFTICIYWKSL